MVLAAVPAGKPSGAAAVPRAAGPRGLYEWSVDEVCEAFSGRAWAPAGFSKRLRVHQIDGMALAELGKEDLRDDLGIAELGTIKKVLRSVDALKKGGVFSNDGTGTVVSADAAQWQQANEGRPTSADSGRTDSGDWLTLPYAAVPRPKPFAAPQPGKKDKLRNDLRSPPVPSPAAAATAVSADSVLSPARDEEVALSYMARNLGLVDLPVPQEVARPPCPVRRLTPCDEAGVVADVNSVSFAGSPLLRSADAGSDACSRPPSGRVVLAPLPARGSPCVAGSNAGRGSRHAEEEEVVAAARTPRSTIRHSIGRTETQRAHPDSTFRPGILELERRFQMIGHLFHVWDTSSNLSVDGSGYIETEELREVLANFYNWSDEEKSERAQSLMDLIDLNGDGQLDRDEFHRYLSDMTLDKEPMDFDHLISYLNLSVGEAARQAESARRTRGILSVFDLWDWDKSGAIEVGELHSVCTRYNTMSSRQGKHSSQLFLTEADGELEELSQAAFLALLSKRSEHLRPEEFDYMVFRLTRCVQDLLQDAQVGLEEQFKPLDAEDLEGVYAQSSPSAPVVLYGLCVDPAMQIEQLAASKGITVRSFLVQHFKSERLALRELVRWGMGRGQWIYVTLNGQYTNCDAFLRALGVALQQQPTYFMHWKFRLWVMVNTTRYMCVPRVLRLTAVPLSLDQLRKAKVSLRFSWLRVYAFVLHADRSRGSDRTPAKCRSPARRCTRPRVGPFA